MADPTQPFSSRQIMLGLHGDGVASTAPACPPPAPPSPPYSKEDMTAIMRKPRPSSSTEIVTQFPEISHPRGGLPDATARPPLTDIRPRPRSANKPTMASPRTKNIMKGFGNFMIEDQSSVLELRPRMPVVRDGSLQQLDDKPSFLASDITTPAGTTSCQHEDGREFPPLSNKAYEYSVHPFNRHSFKPSLDGFAMMKEQIYQPEFDKKKHSSTNLDDRSFGEKLAESISWDRPYYNGGEMGSPSAPQISSDPQATKSSGFGCSSALPGSTRKIFVDMINKKGEGAFEFCGKCMKRHIPWGPPLTLQDRDTCNSQLPEWFPQHRFDKPWEWYIDLINESVKLEEIKQGRRRDPMKPVWDKEYHSPTQAWRDVGRHGGWWKCKSGKEPGQTDVPFVETVCRLCHAPKSPSTNEMEHEMELEQEEYRRTKQNVPTFIEDCLKTQMKKDRAFVEARWKTEGF